VKASSNHLGPENISFDVTAGMTVQSPDMVPGVFATGYRIDYKPGGSAVPIKGVSRPDVCKDGLPIAYHSNNAFYKNTRDPAGVVTNIISANAQLGTNVYTQLTPTGPLASP
jgi:hypothetical protein